MSIPLPPEDEARALADLFERVANSADLQGRANLWSGENAEYGVVEIKAEHLRDAARLLRG